MAPRKRIVGEPPEAEFRSVGAADDDGAGLPEMGNDRRVLAGHMIREGWNAVGGRLPGHVDILLDGDRNAMQWSDRSSGRHDLIGGARRTACLVIHAHRDGVHMPIDLVHAGDVALHHLESTHLPSADRRHRLSGAPLPPVLHQRHAPVFRAVRFPQDRLNSSTSSASGMSTNSG